MVMNQPSQLRIGVMHWLDKQKTFLPAPVTRGCKSSRWTATMLDVQVAGGSPFQTVFLGSRAKDLDTFMVFIIGYFKIE